MKKILNYSAAALMAGLFITQHAFANPMGLVATSGATSATGTVTLGQDQITPTALTGWTSVSATGTFTTPPATVDEQTLDVTSTAAGTLTLFFSVSGITTAGSKGLITLTANQVIPNGLTVSDMVFVDTANGIDTNSASVSGLPQVGPTLTLGGLALTSGTGNVPAGPFSVTEELIISASAAGQTANITAEFAEIVPDGGITLTMLGGALCAIGAIRRKNGVK